MTQVDFHTGLADKLPYACRLLRKALRAGGRVVVTGDPALLARLDHLLWVFETTEFIPHARLRAGEAPAAHLHRTPIWLVEQPADAGDCEVLVNLGPHALPEGARALRAIELVAADADDVQAGRQRWRAHVAAGRTPTNRSAAAAN